MPHQHQVVRDLAAQVLEHRVVVQRLAVARAAAGRRRRSGRCVPGPGSAPAMRSASSSASSTSLVTRMIVRCSCFADALDLVLRALARVSASSARERLVQQQDLGLHRQRPGDRDALAHAARELGGLAVHGVAEADQLDLAVDQRRALGPRPVLVHRVDRQRDVVVDAEPGQQRVGLEHQAAVGAAARRSARPAATLPPSGSISPAIAEISVVLPAPEKPRMATNSPALDREGRCPRRTGGAARSPW